MTGTKIDELIASIPLLDIDLGDIFNFKEKCIDNLAKEIITSTLDYALETSLRRMESVAKINPRIQQDAINNVLPAVKTLAEAIRRAPECDTAFLANAPVVTVKPKPAPSKKKPAPAKEAPKKEAEKEIIEKLTDLIATEEMEAEAKPAAEIKAEPLTTLIVRHSRKKVQGVPGVSTPTGESPITGATGKKAASAGGGDIVEVGKQFTIGFDGQERKYHIVAPQFFRDKKQQEADPSVIPIPDNSALAKLVTGTRKGDQIDATTFGVVVPNSGEITKVEIREVTAPTLIYTGPLGAELIDTSKEDWSHSKDVPSEKLNTGRVDIDDTTLADIGIPKIKPVGKFENEPEEGGEGL